MYNLLKSTYTYETLKDGIFKALGEFSLNGSESSMSSGFLADTEKKFVATLNICLRRIALSLPLLLKSVDLQFFSHKAPLPADFGRIESIFISGIGSVSESAYRVNADMLECSAVSDGGFATVSYRVMPGPFTPDMPSQAPVELPDITADALCYLTASELCPPEYGELYSKLIYKYRDICLNFYSLENAGGSRNSFYKSAGRKGFSSLRRRD